MILSNSRMQQVVMVIAARHVHSPDRLAEGTLTILGTRFDHHVANGHAFLHAHGCDGITGELHGLVGAACVAVQYATLP